MKKIEKEKPKTIEPGQYRVFLTPSALHELMEMVNWGGFGLKSHRTAQTPLLSMIREGVTLHKDVHITENHAEGLAPSFTQANIDVGLPEIDRQKLGVGIGDVQQADVAKRFSPVEINFWRRAPARARTER